MLLCKEILYFFNITLTLTIFSVHICFGQNTQVHFEHITTEEGLSQNDVNCIYQDKKGFLWLGTHDGLNKYDGYDFTIYKPEPDNPNSINSNLIYSIAAERSGKLWIGTTGSGLNLFDPETETFTHYIHEPLDPTSLTSDYIFTLFEDSKRRLWVATSLGLCVWDRASTAQEKPVFIQINGQAAIDAGLASDRAHAFFEDSRGVIWLGTQNGLYRFEESNNAYRFKRVYGGDLRANPFVNGISENQLGHIILATNTGLFYQRGENEFTQLLSGVFHSITVDHYGQIWVGSRQGLNKIVIDQRTEEFRSVDHYQNDVFIPHSLNKNLIRSLLIDQTGIIWIGTNGGGLNKIDPKRKQFRHYKKDLLEGSLNYNKIRSIFEDSHRNIWIGTEGGGLNYQLTDDDDGTYQHFQHISQPRNIFAINETQQNGVAQVLIGAAEAPTGFYEVDIAKLSKQNNLQSILRTVPLQGSIFTIFQSKSGIIWLGTYSEGLYRLEYDPQQQNYKTTNYRHDPQNNQGLSSNIVRSITEDESGNLWVGTAEGLNKLPNSEQGKSSPTFTHYQHGEEDGTISHDYILSMFWSGSDELWVGTFGGGLNRYLPDSDSFQSFREKDGLPNDVIKGILEDDDGHLWLASNKGLTKFDPITHSVVNYDTNDGLQSNEFSELACFKRKNGEMLFGGVNGFNAFFPDSIKDNPFIPSVVLTRFNILNQPVKVGEQYNDRVLLSKPISDLKQLNLKHNENSFSFEFSALHFSAPQKNQYAFKLEGFQEDWVSVSSERRFANYTNLTHGSYRFMVKASNNDGKWNETPTVIDIEIMPPFWLTWWAYCMYVGVLGLLLVAFRRYTVIGIKEKHQLELEHLEKEQAEELQQIKLRFFTNISHELRTPLTLIAGPMDQLIKKGKVLSETQIQYQYKLIKRNADYLLRLINQLLDFRKIDQGMMELNIKDGDLLGFMGEIVEPFQFIAQKKQLEYGLECDFQELNAYFDSDILEKALYNLLSNAFKFTPEYGRVIVKLTLEERQLQDHSKQSALYKHARIEVVDSGPGIAAEKQEMIFDRFFHEPKRSHKNKEGTGIGLAFTKSLVELHYGYLEVESKVGEGACFAISIPIEKRAFLQNGHEISSDPTKSASKALEVSEEVLLDEKINPVGGEQDENKSKPLLMVVDDHEDIRNYIKDGLQDSYRIIEARDGREGVHMAQKQLPNLIISDVMMPELNGIELCMQLKDDPNCSHIPIILLTARAAEESEIQGLQSGADGYIRKPFKLEILKLKLHNILSHREELHKRFRKEVFLDPSEVTVTSADEIFLKDAVDIIENHMDNPDFSVEEMAKEIGMSRSKFYLKIKALTGQSSSEFIRTVRLKRAVQLFEKSNYSVKEIMYMTGFSTPSYFSKCFKKQFGMTPSEFVMNNKEVA